MSSHRRRHRREEIKETGNGLNFNNLDLNSIAAILNSIDINQLSSIVGGLTQSEAINEEDYNSINKSDITQRRNEIVKALTTLINADKSELLQVVLQLYGRSKAGTK